MYSYIAVNFNEFEYRMESVVLKASGVRNIRVINYNSFDSKEGF